MRAIDLTSQEDDLWVRMRKGFAMPNLVSPLVLDRQIYYTSRPSYIKRMVERSRRYLYHIVEELEKRNMPTELALLPMVESAFNPMAYSSAHASGLWQFIPGTGRRYDLAQTWWYDGRRDIIASTTAALDYLQFLYEMHGDWQLALASYNWGENAVARAIEKNRKLGLPGDFLSLTMPAETRYYVPKLQALKNIVANPTAFNIDLDPIPNQPYFVTVPRNQDIDLRIVARLAEMPVEELLALNPGHNRPVLPGSAGANLVLPIEHAEIYKANLAKNDKPLSAWQTYIFKSGDKLETIASRNGMTLVKFKQVNGIYGKVRVSAGQPLLVPVKGSGAAAESLPAMFQPPATPAAKSRVSKVSYTVKKGDTLESIAQRYKVSVDDLRRWNTIGRLSAGQKLSIQVTTTATASSKKTTARKSPAKNGKRVSVSMKPPAR
ncbi:MAG: transglycosylase SLT domain-containing protein [Proteobacteria bacterium]|nr:transglycosylase SLT domain-containing protein [Pseudomonadota bacterium]